MDDAQGQSAEGRTSVIGRVIAGKFRIDAHVGGGAMGAVYKARQVALDKDVAIKLLHGEHAGDAMFAARFEREARAASKLDHPNSMRVIDFGQEPDGLLYIAMEFLDGRDLFHMIQEDWPLGGERTVDILCQALAAIAVAHEMGIVHRDLKPENIMMLRGTDDEGRPRDLVKVCDFGIAKFTDAPRAEPGEPAGKGGKKLTTQGLVVGTPEYMSPEQGRGEVLDARSDLYSMGVILYQLLTGRVPFDAESALGIVLKHVTEEPPPPRTVNPDANPALEAICMKALRKKREERYQTAREMRQELRSAVIGPEAIGHSSTVKLAAQSDPHASTAVALDSGQLAAAVASSKITPTTTVTEAVSPPPSRRGRAVWGVAVVAVALGGFAIAKGSPLWSSRSDTVTPAEPSKVSANLIHAEVPAAPSTSSAHPMQAVALEPAPLDRMAPKSVPGPAPTTKFVAPPAVPVPAAVTTAATPVATPVLVPPPVVATAAPPNVPTAPSANPPPPQPVAPVDPTSARVGVGAISTTGDATEGAVRKAVGRLQGAWTTCYQNALKRGGKPIGCSLTVSISTDDSGHFSHPSIQGAGDLPGLGGCIQGVTNGKIDGVDTGNASAVVTLILTAQ